MKFLTKTFALSLVTLTVLCLFGCGQNSRAELDQSDTVSKKTESTWARLIREIPDTTGILNAVLDGNLAKVKELVQNDSSLFSNQWV